MVKDEVTKGVGEQKKDQGKGVWEEKGEEMGVRGMRKVMGGGMEERVGKRVEVRMRMKGEIRKVGTVEKEV